MPAPFPVRPLAWFVAQLQAGTPFAFSRWGDGEWHAVLGRVRGHNCDRHPFSLPLSQALRAVLDSRPPYLLGMQRLAQRIMGPRIRAYLEPRTLHRLDWIDADVFHDASRLGQLGPLVAALNARAVLLVGPPHLSKLSPWLGWQQRLEVPLVDCWAQYGQLRQDVAAVLRAARTSLVVGLSCGMPAKVLLHDLFHDFGRQHTLVDFGSVWDVYAGVPSRVYMRAMSPGLPGETGHATT